ncbi:sigma-70 family RNA polymerase sigma factor [Babesia caballi]|uniref:Sigma-70 family RNA polymerase sigma factor n=1 Tax=Babesia caballi TaxID=5871 RepID=A0AAV4LRX7_BABCB|nr:sigma-70 family RNA polymerase sigma factor [Babesia caballi]
MCERGEVTATITLAAGVVKVSRTTTDRLGSNRLEKTPHVVGGGSASADIMRNFAIFLLMAVLIQVEKVCCKKRGETVTIWSVPERNFSKFGNGIGEEGSSLQCVDGSEKCA